MPPAAFYVTVTTTDAITLTSYSEVTGQLLCAIQQTLGDATMFRDVVKADVSEPHVECELSAVDEVMPSRVQARVILRFELETVSKASFDKNAFTAAVRAELGPMLPVKVTKRAVTPDELALSG